MEIATLISNNDRLDYNYVFKAYSIYEYLKSQGNNVQIIDYNILQDKKNKKVNMLYNFLNNNTILTLNRYRSLENLNDSIPLADRYLIVDGKYKDLNVKLSQNENIAYGAKDLTLEEIKKLNESYIKISSYNNFNQENVEEVVEPIFLLSSNQWEKIIEDKKTIDIKDDYILLYVDDASKEKIKYASNIAKNNNLKLIVVSNRGFTIFTGAKKFNNIFPINLIYLIKNAKEVITSLPDGIIFSMIFEKKLNIFEDENKEEKNIIQRYKLDDLVIKDEGSIINSNYVQSLKIVEKLKDNSFKFLKM